MEEWGGKVVKTYQVNCGLCDVLWAAPGHDYASTIKALRAEGWRKRGEYRWCCPTCVQKLSAQKTTEQQGDPQER